MSYKKVRSTLTRDRRRVTRTPTAGPRAYTTRSRRKHRPPAPPLHAPASALRAAPRVAARHANCPRRHCAACPRCAWQSLREALCAQPADRRGRRCQQSAWRRARAGVVHLKRGNKRVRGAVERGSVDVADLALDLALRRRRCTHGRDDVSRRLLCSHQLRSEQSQPSNGASEEIQRRGALKNKKTKT